MPDPLPSPRPLVREGFLFEPLDEGCLLYHPDSGKLITLNAAAEAILTCCTGEFTTAEIIDLAAQQFDLDPADSSQALQHLREQGVI